MGCPVRCHPCWRSSIREDQYREQCCCPVKISPFLLNSHSLFLVKKNSLVVFLNQGIKKPFPENDLKKEASSEAEGGGKKSVVGAGWTGSYQVAH